MSDSALRVIDAKEAAARVEELADVLLDCVQGGASVSFMSDMSRDEARAFWQGAIVDAESGGRAIIVAESDGRIDGTVQTVFVRTPNQPHRAEVAKMLVHRRARNKGLGLALLRAAEDAARDRKRWLMVLDTVPEMEGDRLYLRGGWTPVGVIPNYALMPDGALCSTRLFYKDLRGAGGEA